MAIENVPILKHNMDGVHDYIQENYTTLNTQLLSLHAKPRTLEDDKKPKMIANFHQHGNTNIFISAA